MNWPGLLSIAACALTIFAAGYLPGFCHGRYGWRRPLPLPTVFRRRPADIWRHHHVEAPARGVTIH